MVAVLIAEAQQPWDFSSPSQTIGWPQDYPQCQAAVNPMQSPIDFAQVPVDFSLRPLPGDWAKTTQFNISTINQVSLTIYPLVGVPAIAHPTTRRFYKLKSAHVYTPSIHTFGGTHRDMEIALLHELAAESAGTTNGDANESPASQFISVSLTFIAGPLMVDNTFIESIFGVDGSVPSGSVNGGSFTEPVNATVKRTVNWASAAPLSRDYFVYEGSLPTPPCTPGVEHYVHSTPTRMSYAQLADVRRILGFSSNPSGVVSGFEDADPVAVAATAFDIDGNVRSIPSSIELRKALISEKLKTSSSTVAPIRKFMDFVGDHILLKEPKHTSFMDSLETSYQVVYGLGVVSFVLSLVALRIGVS